MFMNAKKVPAAPTTKGKKATAKIAQTFPGLAEVAALEACSKAIEGLIKTKKAMLKDVARDALIEHGLDRHGRPDTMHLAEGDYATGRATVVKRSDRSPLTADELEMLADLLPDEVETDDDNNVIAVKGFAETSESGPSYYAVNNAYVNDNSLMERAGRALSRVKGIPDDFIIQTTPPSKIVASDMATDAVFRLTPEVAEQVFPLVAGVTLGTVFQDLTNAWEIVKPMLVPVDAKSEAKKTLKAALVATAAALSE